MFDFNLEFARGGARFTADLLQRLATGGNTENIVFSPFSVQMCVALALAGATGDTASEIATALRFASSFPPEVANTFGYVLHNYKDSPLLRIANKIYIKEGHNFKPDYEAVTQDYYLSEFETVDFAANAAAAATINSWVNEKTAGKIPNIITADCLDENTRLVLLNALHFKGDWQHKFDAADTLEDDFWTGEETAVQVPYMQQKANFEFGYFEDLDCLALEMPYKDSDLSLLALLPQEREGLQQLAQKLQTVNLIDLTEQMSSTEVQVKFPKFKVDYTIDLKQKLQELGIHKMFTDTAEFDNMLESPEGIYVSEVLHKASIEVNEEGAEAAAATGLVMMTRMMLAQQFVADHPFLYVIWNKKNIFFAGAFLNAA